MKTRKPSNKIINIIARQYRNPKDESVIKLRTIFYSLVKEARKKHNKIMPHLISTFYCISESSPTLPEDELVGVEALSSGQARLIDKEGFVIATSKDNLPRFRNKRKKPCLFNYVIQNQSDSFIYETLYTLNQGECLNKNQNQNQHQQERLKIISNNDLNIPAPISSLDPLTFINPNKNSASYLQFHSFNPPVETDVEHIEYKWTESKWSNLAAVNQSNAKIQAKNINHYQASFSPLFFKTEIRQCITLKQKELAHKKYNQVIDEIEAEEIFLNFINNGL